MIDVVIIARISLRRLHCRSNAEVPSLHKEPYAESSKGALFGGASSENGGTHLWAVNLHEEPGIWSWAQYQLGL